MKMSAFGVVLSSKVVAFISRCCHKNVKFSGNKGNYVLSLQLNILYTPLRFLLCPTPFLSYTRQKYTLGKNANVHRKTFI